MKITIRDAVYDWDGEYTFKESLFIEKMTGVPFTEWLEGLSVKARAEKAGIDTTADGWEAEAPAASALDLGLWLFTVVHRADPKLSFDDFDFKMTDVAFEAETVDPTSEAEASEPSESST